MKADSQNHYRREVMNWWLKEGVYCDREYCDHCYPGMYEKVEALYQKERNEGLQDESVWDELGNQLYDMGWRKRR